MDQIIRDFYRGTVTGFERNNRLSPEYQKRLEEIAKIGKEIEEMLPEEGKALFEKYTDSYVMLSSKACEEDYVLGYRAGARFMMAALVGNSDDESFEK